MSCVCGHREEDHMRYGKERSVCLFVSCPCGYYKRGEDGLTKN